MKIDEIGKESGHSRLHESTATVTLSNIVSVPMRILTSLALAVMLSSTTSHQPLVQALPTPALRWMQPCLQGVSLTGLSADTSSQAAAAGTDTSSSVTRRAATSLNIAETFHTLGEKTMKLKKSVRDLKTLYVQQRFRDTSITEDLDQMGLRLNGMPHVRDATIESVNSANLVEIVHRAFEHLARIAVFLDQARLGERLAVNEAISFEKHFERIEDHHEDGLYWIMCSIHQVIYHLGEHPQTEVIQEIKGMRVAEVDRNAMRHTRDYLVLRDFERILNRLSIDFATVRDSSVLRPDAH